MPYKVMKRGDQWCVVKEDDGKSMGCHDSDDKAQRQMAALHANEKTVEKTIVRYTQQEAGFVPLSAEAGQACVNCRWFAGSAEGGPYCNVIENYPLHVEANSWCQQWVMLPAGMPMEAEAHSEPMGAMEAERAETEIPEPAHEHDHNPTQTIYAAPDSNQPGILKTLRQKFQHGLKPGQSILKGADGQRLMLIVTSNSYPDREDETLTSAALKEDVDRHWTQGDDAFMSNNPLLFWHDDDLPVGDIVWGDLVGPFYVEVAREASTPVAKAYFDYREQHPDEAWGASHRFAYFTQHRSEGGDYSRIFKKETTTLPLEAAANLFTLSGVLPMSDKRAKKFDEIMGLEGGYNMIKTEGIDALIRKLQAQGIEHKAVDGVTETPPATVQESEAVASIAKALVDTMDDQESLVKEIDDAKTALAEATAQFNAKTTELTDAIKAVTEMQAQLKTQLDNRPRSASRAAETQIENTALAEEVAAALMVNDPVFGPVKPL